MLIQMLAKQQSRCIVCKYASMQIYLNRRRTSRASDDEMRRFTHMTT